MDYELSNLFVLIKMTDKLRVKEMTLPGYMFSAKSFWLEAVVLTMVILVLFGLISIALECQL